MFLYKNQQTTDNGQQTIGYAIMILRKLYLIKLLQ